MLLYVMAHLPQSKISDLLHYSQTFNVERSGSETFDSGRWHCERNFVNYVCLLLIGTDSVDVS